MLVVYDSMTLSVTLPRIILLDLKFKIKCSLILVNGYEPVTEFHTFDNAARLSWEGKQCKS